MDWTELLFSFEGRIQRLYWWIANLGVAIVLGATSAAIEAVARSQGLGAINSETNQFEPTGPLGIFLAIIGLLNFWITYALAAKRLHDRDRSGWWLMAPLLALAVAIALAFSTLSFPEGQREPWNSTAVLATLATFAITGWLFLEVGFLPGTHGANRYGPDPLGQEHIE